MADFPLTPDFPVEVKTEYKTLKSERENGTIQRRKKWQNKRREFPLKFSVLTETEKNQLMDFFELKNGSLTSFTYYDLESEADVTCIFKEDSLAVSMISPGIWTASCTLEEEL